MYNSDNKNVNPEHYKQGKIEAIKVMEGVLSPEEFKGFCKGLIIKYVYRADEKNGVEDYEKAAWYLNYLIKILKKVSK